MSDRQYFGTDGIRGEAGQFPIVPEFIQQLAWAAGRVLAPPAPALESAGRERVIVLGHDGRASHSMIQAAIIQGLQETGVSVFDCGFCPTPAVAYLTQRYQAQAGIVISASHNPAKDNGIKFFNARGGKLNLEQELAIEALLTTRWQQTSDCTPTERLAEHDAEGPTSRASVTYMPDAVQHYEQFCLQSVAEHLDLTGWKIVVDCANGAMSPVAPPLFKHLGAEVHTCFDTPNGININGGCGATALAALSREVVATQAHIGIAFDGDGDRVMMVDAQGKTLDGDGMLYVIARDWQAHGELEGGVVGTVMSNMALEQQLQQLGIAFARTQVGDIWVLAECHARKWPLGGEPSGHIICLNKATTGDGLVAALQVLAAVQRSGQGHIAQALRGYEPYPHTLVNIKVPEPKTLARSAQLSAAIQESEQLLAKNGRILVRPSGTEPLIRILVEGKDAATNQRVAQNLADIVTQLAASH